MVCMKKKKHFSAPESIVIILQQQKRFFSRSNRKIQIYLCISVYMMIQQAGPSVKIPGSYTAVCA